LFCFFTFNQWIRIWTLFFYPKCSESAQKTRKVLFRTAGSNWLIVRCWDTKAYETQHFFFRGRWKIRKNFNAASKKSKTINGWKYMTPMNFYKRTQIIQYSYHNLYKRKIQNLLRDEKYKSVFFWSFILY